MIQGKKAELAHIDSLESNDHAHIMDTKSALKETRPKIQQVDHLDTDFSKADETGVIKNKIGGDHVKPISLEDQNFKYGTLSSTPDQIEPSHLKPKNTWTRMN